MTKKIFLCTAFLVMNLCACGTSAATEEVTTTEQSTITANPTEEVTATPETTRNSLSIKKGGESFLYDGKEVPIGTDKSDGAYIMELEYINDTQIAVFCHYTLNAQIFLVYDTEKEEYIAKKTGLDFMWKDKDISTLVYVVTDGKETDLCNYNDEVLYHSKHAMGILSFTEDGKVEIQENLNDLDECDADWVKQEISVK